MNTANQLQAKHTAYNQDHLNQGLASMPAPPKQSEAAYAGDLLDQAINQLGERVSFLADRLTPVMEQRPTAKDDNGGTLRTCTSALGRGIVDAALRIDAIDRRIINLLESLAI